MVRTLLILNFIFQLVILQAQNVNMSNGSVSRCGSSFFDSGGNGSPYGDNQSFVLTISPTTACNNVRLTFTSFATEGGYDFLSIFNGNSIAAPLIGTYDGTNSPGTVTSSAATGALTIRFTSDGSVTAAGWVATISCVATVAMTYTSATSASVAPATSGSCLTSSVQMQRIEVVTGGGTCTPLSLTSLTVNKTGSSPLAAFSRARVYYTGTSSTFAPINEFVAGGLAPAASMTFNATQALAVGTNYFWVVYDLNGTGVDGNTLGARMPVGPTTSITVGGTARTLTNSPNGLLTFAICRGPGGVVNGLSHWVRSDMGVSGNPVTAWADNSIAQILGDLVPLGAGQSPSVQSGVINYQNHIRFDGSNDGLRSTNAVSAVPSGLYSNQNNTIIMVKNIRAAGIDVDYKWEIDGGGTHRMGFELNGNAQRFDFANGFAGQNSVSTTSITNTNNIIGAVTDPTNSSIRINGLVDVTHNHGGSTLAGTGATARHLYIGSNDVTNYAYYCNVDIAEEFTFNRTLSAAELLRVESYLGIKYSITLGNTTTPSNYTSSNSTVIWTGLSAFQNNIIGLGRDDLSGLLTKQSQQSDDRVRVYMNTLQTTNAANTATFSVDRSFLVQGSNTGALCATTASNAEIPTGLGSCTLYSRLEREWRVTRTNMAQNYNMDIRLDACAVPASVNVAHLRLLVDDDGDFSNGGTQCYYNGDGTGIVFSYTSPMITISGISTTHIPNNATRFITIASVNSATPLPVELTHFEAVKVSNQQVNLLWETATERDSDYFLVERSTDLVNWDFVSKVQAAGNSVLPISYHAKDVYPSLGINYYRLRQFDLNGAVSYSDVESVEIYSDKLFSMHPNPASNEVKIAAASFENASIQLVNGIGKVVWQSQGEIQGSFVQIDLESLAEGIYFVQFSAGDKQEIQKLVIKK